MAIKFNERETSILVDAVDAKILAGKAKFEEGNHNFDTLKALMTEIDTLDNLRNKLTAPPKARQPRKFRKNKDDKAVADSAKGTDTAEAADGPADGPIRQRKTA